MVEVPDSLSERAATAWLSCGLSEALDENWSSDVNRLRLELTSCYSGLRFERG